MINEFKDFNNNKNKTSLHHTKFDNSITHKTMPKRSIKPNESLRIQPPHIDPKLQGFEV